MKKIILSLILSLMMSLANAQDIIKMRNGEAINSKVVEMSENQIKYKKTSNPNGPAYVIETSNVESVTFENGEKEIYVASKSDNNDLQSIKKSVNIIKYCSLGSFVLAALSAIGFMCAVSIE